MLSKCWCMKKNQVAEKQEENQAHMQRNYAKKKKKELTTLQHFVIFKNIPLSIAHFWRITEFEDSNVFEYGKFVIIFLYTYVC